MIAALAPLLVLGLAMLLLPAIGALIAGIPLGELLALPLSTRAWDPLPLAPTAVGLACAVAAASVLLPLWLARPSAGQPPRSSDPGRSQTLDLRPLVAMRLVVWGALLLGAALALALAGLPGVSQPTLILGLTLGLAGDTKRRTGTSLLTKRPGYLLLLYPVSALIGWLFHWLNLFVQLWIYPNADADSAIPFVLVRTLDYATLLPALMILRQWLGSWRGLLEWSSRAREWGKANDLPSSIAAPDRRSGLWLGLSALGLAGAGVWPDWVWPLTWMAPLLLAIGLQGARSHPGPFAAVRRGDWSRVLSVAAAALLLGILIQGWNHLAGPVWVFQLPLIHELPLFGLPLPGYVGLLPLGLLGLWIADQLTHPWRRRPLGRPGPFPVRLSVRR